MTEPRRILVDEIAAELKLALLKQVGLYGDYPQAVLEAAVEVEARQVLIRFLSDGRDDCRL